MRNVDGDYSEILAWMDANPVNKVRHTLGHGTVENDEGLTRTLNVGLFSVNDTHFTNCGACAYGSPSHGSHICEFKQEGVWMDGGTKLKVENPEKSHLITF